MPDYKHRLAGRQYWTLPELVVLSKDIFHLEYFYFLIHDWCLENKYGISESGANGDSDFPEEFFLQRDAGGASELIIHWRLYKPYDKIKYKDPHFHFEFDVKIHILGMKPAEVVINNQKFGAHKGEVEVKIRPRLHHDRPFTQGWYSKVKDYLIERPLKDKYRLYQGEMIKDMMKLQDALKAYFDMDTYGAFHPLQHFYKTREEGGY